MARVTIIGAGMMGTAMCWPLVDRGHTVRLVGTPLDAEIIRSLRRDRVHPGLARKVPAPVEPLYVDALASAIADAELLINGVSSFGIEWFASAAGPYLRPAAPVLSVTKGLAEGVDGSLVTLPTALDDRLPPHLHGRISLNAIGGPCIAHELAARRPTSVVFTGPDPDLLSELQALLSTAYYHVWVSTDVTAVEVCAALKNAYALGVGLAVGMMEALGPDGLAHLYNPQAALFGQSCYEMRRLVSVLGGDPRHVDWLPGAGDLYVTVFGGRTVRLGTMLGQGMPFAEARRILAGVTLESVEIATRVGRAIPRLARSERLEVADFPLILHLYEVIDGGAPVNIPWSAFFRAP